MELEQAMADANVRHSTVEPIVPIVEVVIANQSMRTMKWYAQVSREVRRREDEELANSL